MNLEETQDLASVANEPMETAQPENGAEQPTEPQPEPTLVLFEQIGFETIAHYDNFVGQIRSLQEKELLILMNYSLRVLNKRGVMTLEESEIMSVALRALNSILDKPAA